MSRKNKDSKTKKAKKFGKIAGYGALALLLGGGAAYFKSTRRAPASRSRSVLMPDSYDLTPFSLISDLP